MFRANKSGGRLTKLRYVCSMCSVNCIDEHGFAQHLRSQKHMENEMQEEERRRLNGPKAYEVDAVSARFEESFLELLAARHLDQRVLAHEVYHEAFHHDRPMHALKKTCWGSFGQFITSLRDRGRLDAERDAKGWLVCLRAAELGPGGALPAGSAMPAVPRPKRRWDEAAAAAAAVPAPDREPAGRDAKDWALAAASRAAAATAEEASAPAATDRTDLAKAALAVAVAVALPLPLTLALSLTLTLTLSLTRTPTLTTRPRWSSLA